MGDTDWPQIAGLYEVLLRISPSPVIELNHAAAVSMVDGPARALALIDALQARGKLDGYDLLPAVRADVLRRLGERAAAREAYLAATAATQLEPLRRLYARRMAEMDYADPRHPGAMTSSMFGPGRSDLIVGCEFAACSRRLDFATASRSSAESAIGAAASLPAS